MKKIIIITVAILAIGVVVALFFTLLKGQSSSKSNTTETSLVGGNLPITETSNQNTTNSAGTASPSDVIGSASQVLEKFPKDPILTIGSSEGSVGIKNFYLSNPNVSEGGSIVVKQTQNYSILYASTDSSFWLVIIGTPFDKWREAAEQDFLSVLQINATDACKLKASSGIYYDATNSLSGKSFPLSFCNQSFQ